MPDYTKYKIVKKWVNHYADVLDITHPEIDKKDVKEFLFNIVEKNIKVPNAVIDNNYIHEKMKFDLLAILDWIDKTKPICAGHGVFFRNQNQVLNPAAQTLLSTMDSRSKYKSKLKICEDGSYEYKTYDRLQGAEKVVSNSFYGANGCPSSRFYNLYTASSTTNTAQQLTSTAMLSFEAFLAGNIQFFNLDDCLHYLMQIKKEKYKIDDDFLEPVLPEMVYKRISSMFHEWSDEYAGFLNEFIYSCSPRLLKRIYYKNNLYTFLELPEMHEILQRIMSNVKEFNDPNKVPEEIKDDMELLWSYLEQFVYSDQFYFGRIKRLKAFRRKAVVAVDTDSCILTVDPFINYVFNSFVKPNPEILAKGKDTMKFAAVNIAAFNLTKLITAVLHSFTKKANVPKEFRHRINMKNEFLFGRMVLTTKKKRYGTVVLLREGKRKNDIDVKGADFMKSSACIETMNYFKKLLEDEYLRSEDISTGRILGKIMAFKDIINESLRKGEKTFLIPKNVKEIESYKDPYGQQGIRGVLLWNAIYPEQQIELPEKTMLVKLTLTDEYELEKLKKKYPEVYDVINKNVLQHPNKKYAEKMAGVIAIPSFIKELPQWVLDFTDIDTIVDDNITKFYSFLDSIGAVILPSASGKASHFSNIIQI